MLLALRAGLLLLAGAFFLAAFLPTDLPFLLRVASLVFSAWLVWIGISPWQRGEERPILHNTPSWPPEHADNRRAASWVD